MDARDLFLDQHSIVHSAAVGGNAMSSAERVFGGLSDEQMRIRPREDLNSLAWIMWHIARTEDIFVNLVLTEHSASVRDGPLRRSTGTYDCQGRPATTPTCRSAPGAG